MIPKHSMVACVIGMRSKGPLWCKGNWGSLQAHDLAMLEDIFLYLGVFIII
jgi:hypothetical protein